MKFYPRGITSNDKFPYSIKQTNNVTIDESDNRKIDNVWNYKDANDLNTDQMFAGNLTYSVLSSEPEKIMPHLFKGFDVNFTDKVQKDDIIFAGSNFGCGSSRKHPAVGLAHAGVKAVICGSVNRIFYRSSVNQGLPIIILPEAAKAYKSGDKVDINFVDGIVTIGDAKFKFAASPEKLMSIFESNGLVNYFKSNS